MIVVSAKNSAFELSLNIPLGGMRHIHNSTITHPLDLVHLVKLKLGKL